MSSFLKERTVPKHSGNSQENPMLDEDHEAAEFIKIQPESEESRTLRDRKLLVLAVHFCNVLYACCFWINVGVYPYITKSIGIDVVTYGYLQTTFGALQLVGGPLYGRLGDIFGSRAVLVLAHSCGMSSYFLLAIAASPAMLFLSRLPSLLMHGAQGAQMAMTDLTSHKERAVALGQLGFSYGAGVIIGPFLGGQISKYISQKAAISVAAFLSLLAMVFVMIFIPKFTRKIEKPKKGASTSVFNFRKLKEIVLTPGVGFIYFIKFVAGMPFGIFQSMFAVVVVNTFKLTPAEHGMFMSYIGTLMIVVQGFAIGFVTKRMSEKNTLVFAMALCTFAYVLWFLSYNALHLCILVIPLVFGGALFTVVNNSILTKLVPPEDTGFVLGLSFATQSLVRTLSPTIGGILLSRFGHTSFGAVGFSVCSIVAFILFVKENLRTEA